MTNGLRQGGRVTNADNPATFPRVRFYFGRDMMRGPGHWAWCIHWSPDPGALPGAFRYRHSIEFLLQLPRFRIERR